MRTFLVLVGLFAATAALAQVSPDRQAKLEYQTLQALLTEQVGKVAHVAALYQMEKEDHDADKKSLADLRAWIDAWFKDDAK